MLVEWMKHTFHTQRTPIQPSLIQKLSKPQLTYLSTSWALPPIPLTPQAHTALMPSGLTPAALPPTNPQSSHALSPDTCTPHTHRLYPELARLRLLHPRLMQLSCPEPYPYSPHSPPHIQCCHVQVLHTHSSRETSSDFLDNQGDNSQSLAHSKYLIASLYTQ